MAWTAPMTAVENATFTSAEYNAHVRDNLSETLPAKATAAGGYYLANGTNSIVERFMGSQVITTSETTTSTSFTNLATSGPAVTLTTGTSAIVWFSTGVSHSAANASSTISVGVSGATTVAISDNWAHHIDGIANSGNFRRTCVSHTFTGLTPGSNTFTMQYKVGSGTGTFQNRELIVMAL